MTMENYKELEYKYNAENVKLIDFQKLMEDLNIVNYVDASSWDIYYTRPGEKEEFLRYRKSPTIPELTRKRRVSETNVWERIEVDIPLDPKRIKEDDIKAWATLDGMMENFRIYKSCFIYFLEDINYVYYTVYDINMHEKGRFMEVEINKHRLEELGDRAKDVLKEGEDKLAPLGISAKNRMRLSLFDRFVTDNKIKIEKEKK
jgi:hypothetical protein